MSNEFIPVGLDLGTSTVKVVSRDVKFTMPSIIGDAISTAWEGITEDKSLLRNLVYIDGDREVYVGELARLQSPLKLALAAQGKMKSLENAVLAIKAVLAVLNIEIGWNKFVLTSGVSVATRQDETIELSKALTGNHSFKIKNDATGKVYPISIEVQRTYVLPEPYGTYWLTLKSLGESKAVDAVVCDIGHGSTDFLCMYNGGIMRAASGSIAEAVDSLTVAIARTLQEKVGKIIKPFELTDVIRKGRTSIMVAGKNVDISKAVEQAVVSIADVIVEECNRLLNNLPPDAWIDKVIVTGGGAYLFGEYLKQAFVDNNIVGQKNEVIVPVDPELSNAQGFEEIAKTKQK